MRSDAETLGRARANAGLSLREMADLVEIDATRLERMESGAEAATPELLDRCARTFGISLRRFLAEEVPETPAAVLFRYLHTEGPSFTALLESGAAGALRGFLRAASDIAELREALGDREDRLARALGEPAAPPVSDGTSLRRQAEQLALDVRQRLELGQGPVPSMIELVEGRLGVEIFWASPDELDRDIDGACTRAPLPAILVNLIGGPGKYWRTRMTLAHELCHLLFDGEHLAGGPGRRFFLFSPGRRDPAKDDERSRIRLPAALELIERRANAFAAHFLAPREGVRAVVGELGVTSDEAINAVCKHFLVGRVVAVNQITNIFNLSKETRLEMLARPPSDVLPKNHPDADVPLPDLGTGRLQDFAARALAAGRISRVQAREYLGLKLTDFLPDPSSVLSDEQRAPLHSAEHVARLQAQRGEIARTLDRHPHPLGNCEPPTLADVLGDG